MPDRFERLHGGHDVHVLRGRIEKALNGVSDVQHVHVDLKQGTRWCQEAIAFHANAERSWRGYSVIADEVAEADTTTATTSPASAASFVPLLVAVALIGLGSLAAGGGEGFMARFMGGFFLVFGGLKLLDLRGFVSAYAMYDVLAARVTAYGWVYPFLEVGLGLAYLAVPCEANLHLATLGLMSFSSVGVVLAVTRGEQLKCACMGTAFNLPMTTVTIVEDLGMAAMAAVMWMQSSTL